VSQQKIGRAPTQANCRRHEQSVEPCAILRKSLQARECCSCLRRSRGPARVFSFYFFFSSFFLFLLFLFCFSFVFLLEKFEPPIRDQKSASHFIPIQELSQRGNETSWRQNESPAQQFVAITRRIAQAVRESM